MSGWLVTATGWTGSTDGRAVTRVGNATEFAMTISGRTTTGMFSNAAMVRDEVLRIGRKNTIDYNLVPAHSPFFVFLRRGKRAFSFIANRLYCEGVPS